MSPQSRSRTSSDAFGTDECFQAAVEGGREEEDEDDGENDDSSISDEEALGDVVERLQVGEGGAGHGGKHHHRTRSDESSTDSPSQRERMSGLSDNTAGKGASGDAGADDEASVGY